MTDESSPSVPVADSPRSRVRPLRLAVGVLLIAAFYSLDSTSNTLNVGFPTPWDMSTTGELYFWLASVLFLLPGSAMVGAAFEDWIVGASRAISARLARATRAESTALVVLTGYVGFVLAYIGRAGFLLDLPLTDDEGAARFGGQVLATGHLMARIPPMRFAFEDLFLYERAGRWTSMDFPGALLPWTVDELTGKNGLVFRLFASFVPIGVAFAVRRRMGMAYALVAAALVLLSPMASLLSMMNHTFVVSRGALALGFGAVLFLERGSFSRGLLAGVAFGIAGLARPPETFALVTPLLAVYAHRAFVLRRDRETLLGILAGVVPMIVGLAVYDLLVTGTFATPRSAANVVVHPYGGTFHGAFDFGEWPKRFGTNVSYNLLTLVVYFVGPIGALLVAGSARESSEHRALLVGVAAAFGLALLHDDRGIHFVGPIHYSDTVVPLTILSVAGVRRIGRFVVEKDLAPRTLGSGAVGYFALGLPLFTLWQSAALGEHASRLDDVLRRSSAGVRRPAIVLAPSIGRVRRPTEAFSPLGSFVFTWPRPSPTRDEPILFLRDSEQARHEVRAAFPNRAPYVLMVRQGRYVPVPLARAEAISESAPAPSH